MSFINKLSYIPITVPQEPQPEVTGAPQTVSQEPISLGVGSSPDLFETAAPNNFDLLQQQFQSATPIQPSTTRELTVDSSSVFSFFEASVPHLDNRLSQLNDQLNSLQVKKRELMTKIEHEVSERMEKQKAVDSVREALQSDKPIPDDILTLLGPLGILGVIGGLPALPILGALGIFTGLSVDYREKAKKIVYELERQMGEKDLQAEELKSELENVNSEMESVQESIQRERERLEREAMPAQEMTSSDAIVQEPVWQEFLPNQNLVQNDDNRFSSTENPILNPMFSPMFQKKADES